MIRIQYDHFRRTKPFIVTLLLLFVVAVAGAQTKAIQTIVYDRASGYFFKQMTDGSLKQIKGMPTMSAHSPIQLKIININSLKYDVEITTTETQRFSTIPTDLASLIKVIDPLTIGARLIESASGGVKSLDDPESKISNDYVMTLKAFKIQLETLEKCLKCYKSLTEVSTTIESVAQSIEDPRFDQDAYLKDPKAPGNRALKQLREDVGSAVMKHVRQLMQTSPTLFEGKALERNADLDLVGISKSVIDGLDSSYKVLLDDYSAVEAAFSAYKGAITVQVATSKSLAPQEIMQLATTERRIEDIQKQVDKKIESVGKAIEQFKTNEDKNEILIAASERLFKKVMNEDVFEVTAMPSTPHGDYVTFKISVKPVSVKRPAVAESLLASINPQDKQDPSVDVSVKIVGRTKIDYSAGIFFTNVADGSYVLKDDGTNLRVFNGASNDLTQGYGALAHIYRTSTSKIIPALSFGVATADGQPMFMFGGSLIIGDDQRFIFSFGFAAKKVKRLSGISIGDISPDPVPEADVMRTGLFFGLTFNIGR